MKNKKVLYWIGGIIAFFIVIIILAPSPDPVSQNKNGETTTLVAETEKSAPQPIEYLVLREWKPDNDPSALGLEILIAPEDVSQNNIVRLVQSIGSRSNKVVVKVYKTQIAWEAEQNETYGSVYNEGYLAFYVKNTTGSGAYRGTNEIRWFQETGELQDLFGTETQVN